MVAGHRDPSPLDWHRPMLLSANQRNVTGSFACWNHKPRPERTRKDQKMKQRMETSLTLFQLFQQQQPSNPSVKPPNHRHHLNPFLIHCQYNSGAGCQNDGLHPLLSLAGFSGLQLFPKTKECWSTLHPHFNPLLIRIHPLNNGMTPRAIPTTRFFEPWPSFERRVPIQS